MVGCWNELELLFSCPPSLSLCGHVTGYRVQLESLECITSFYSSIGHAGSCQTLFYCEVTDSMRTSEGGGSAAEGEEIEVVHLPMKEGLALVFDQDKPRPSGLLFALMWFEHYKRPLLKI